MADTRARGIGSAAKKVGFVLSLLSALSAFPVLAQREPVLRQVKVPHSYYYREMYLPQATSGPSSATWSPDGRELIYSMQGSLWRQRLGTTEATQLTDGPGYDYQPDWSPDGRFVVYASYRDDHIGLYALDLSTLDSRPLTSDSAVSVEPRWSPDGKLIAYVSTAFQARWHVFVMSIGSGFSRCRPGCPAVQLTEDHDSELPRYYYSRFDHYLSPTWSPDGRELILISNRGHIWGSGAFWRMRAEPGAELTQIHDEETTWKARPDWSRDGRRVVYSSYAGRQWNQLWLMTNDGSNPLQLTYGDFDATAPRWSPDGRKILYVANEGGNASLRIVAVPGGAVEQVAIERRNYRIPRVSLRISVTDAATGKPIPARIAITGADGRSYAPDDAWRHADDSFDRTRRRMEYGYFHSGGSSRVMVPRGDLRYEVSRGPEYRVVSGTMNLSRPRALSVRLARIADLPAKGWYSGDLHVHMNYGGTYRNTPAHLALQARAEDVHLIENLIVNKEGRIPDISYFTGRPDAVSTSTTIIVHDQEFHTSFWGHVGLLGLTRHLLLPGYAGYAGTAAGSLVPTNADVLDLAHAQGAIGGYVHPYDNDPDPFDSTARITHEFPVDVALGKVDYFEALGFEDDYLGTAHVWYRILNCGFRVPTGAGTDFMANYASVRGPIGLNRVFVETRGPLTHERFLAGLKAGRTFATNGPLLGFTLDGHGIGDEIQLPAGEHRLTARVTLRSYVPVDRLEIIGNGKVVATIPLNAGRDSASTSVIIPVDRSGWYLLRALGDQAEEPVLDVFPYATTSPIYVTIGGQPVRSADDAAYFLAWIDRMTAAVQAHDEWNDEREHQAVLDQLGRAREEFERRR
jgi:TolB protein